MKRQSRQHTFVGCMVSVESSEKVAESKVNAKSKSNALQVLITKVSCICKCIKKAHTIETFTSGQYILKVEKRFNEIVSNVFSSSELSD